MNKSELIEKLALKKNISLKRSEEIVNLIFSSMTETLVNGDRIEIRGLGSFVIKDYGTYTPKSQNRRTHSSQPQKTSFFQGWQGIEGTGTR